MQVRRVKVRSTYALDSPCVLLRENLQIFLCLFGKYLFVNFSHLTISNLFEFLQILSF